jgi:hypothetical protein
MREMEECGKASRVLIEGQLKRKTRKHSKKGLNKYLLRL